MWPTMIFSFGKRSNTPKNSSRRKWAEVSKFHIEGVAGVVDVLHGQPGNAEYERARCLMTEKANAAIDGAFAGGVTEVLVNDAHGPMIDLLSDLLDPRAELILGKPKPISMFAGLTEEYAGAICVGYHAGAGQYDVLSNTTDGFCFRAIRVNGINDHSRKPAPLAHDDRLRCGEHGRGNRLGEYDLLYVRLYALRNVIMDQNWVLAIHGGAGTMRHGSMTAEVEAGFRRGLREALEAGRRILAAGGTALDAVTEAVMALEDDPQFNAGRGAVYTTDGKQEMDAAIMDGRDRRTGAVAGICGPRHPVLAARAVMEQSEHVLLIGEGAMRFCRECDLDFVEPDWFRTERRWQALQKELERRRSQAPDRRDDADRHGTVGAVARDGAGNLAAATSTGGMTAKRPGRVGDCPIIGAGTWAENASCAVSATGHGESFIRYAAAHEIAARIRLTGQTLDRAAAAVVQELMAIEGSGGVIAVDAAGNVALPFNSEGMHRGVARADGALLTAIYREELS